MSANRFYYDGELIQGDTVCLSIEETHHLKHVVRKQKGEMVELINGRGQRADATILTFGKHEAQTEIISSQNMNRCTPELWLAMGIPQSDEVMSAVLRSATECGVWMMQPLRTQFSKSSKLNSFSAKKHRWEKIICHSSKQCGQYWFPQINQPITLDLFVHNIVNNDIRWYAAIEPSHDTLRPDSIHQPLPMARKLGLIVGPEGGWMKHEVEILLKSEVIPIRIAPLTLTMQTSVAAGLTVIRFVQFFGKDSAEY